MSHSGPSSPPPERWGTNRPGSYGWSSQGGQPTPPSQYGGQTPYVAASQPGTLPLRPMTLGDYFSAMFATIRQSSGLFFGAALIFGAAAAIMSATGEFFFLRIFQSAALDPYAQLDQVVSGAGFGFLGTTLLSQLVLLLGQTFNWGLYSTMVARGAIGMKTTLSQGFRLLRGQWGKLVGFIALLIAAVIVVWIVALALVFLVFAVAFAGGEPQSGAGIAASILAVIVTMVLPMLVALYFTIRWYVVIPAMIIEDLSVFAGLRRSWTLTRGYFWRTLGIVLLFALILGFVSAIITGPLNFIGTFITTAAGTEAQLFGSILVVNLIISAVSSLVTFIVTNMALLISIFFYFDYRFRKEGLGIHFQQLAAQYATTGTDRFDTSLEQAPAGGDETDDIIPGRHTPPIPGRHTPPGAGFTPPGPVPPGPPHPYPPQQPPYPGQPGPHQGPASPTPPGPSNPPGPTQ